MPTCFVIMPVTTPENFLPIYSNDGAHFQHVLEHLFRPALAQLDFEVIPPTAAGADLIHAQIIENLETADLVLCDMSTLNPNVFFELGIRTALNKPVCMLRDNATPAVPFDNSIINFHTYLSELAPWSLGSEVQKLKEHISSSTERSDGNNMLWRYFGLTSVAIPPAEETSVDAKVDRLTLQVEALNRRLENTPPLNPHRFPQRPGSWSQPGRFIDEAFLICRRLGAELVAAALDQSSPNAVTLQFEPGPLADEARQELMNLAELAGIDLRVLVR